MAYDQITSRNLNSIIATLRKLGAAREGKYQFAWWCDENGRFTCYRIEGLHQTPKAIPQHVNAKVGLPGGKAFGYLVVGRADKPYVAIAARPGQQRTGYACVVKGQPDIKAAPSAGDDKALSALASLVIGVFA